jgi:hypothetical protein
VQLATECAEHVDKQAKNVIYEVRTALGDGAATVKDLIPVACAAVGKSDITFWKLQYTLANQIMAAQFREGTLLVEISMLL